MSSFLAALWAALSFDYGLLCFALGLLFLLLLCFTVFIGLVCCIPEPAPAAENGEGGNTSEDQSSPVGAVLLFGFFAFMLGCLVMAAHSNRTEPPSDFLWVQTSDFLNATDVHGAAEVKEARARKLASALRAVGFTTLDSLTQHQLASALTASKLHPDPLQVEGAKTLVCRLGTAPAACQDQVSHRGPAGSDEATRLVQALQQARQNG